MISFYGGQPGQSFKIQEVFSSFTALVADINKGWKSTIAVDNYIMISYGDPNSSDYESLLTLDLNNQDLSENQRKNWNATLWQKVYKEQDSGNEYAVAASTTGINYKFITSCIGSTSKVEAEVIETLPPGSEAAVLVDKSASSGYPGKVILQFKIPGSLNIKANENITNLEPESSPKVELKAGESDFEKILYFSLPRNAQFHSVDSINDKIDWIQGDYYFYTITGALYGYENGWKELIIFQPSFIEQASVTKINPYTSSNNVTSTPIVNLTNENGKWKFNFSLPAAPIINATYNMVGAADEGGIMTINTEGYSNIGFDIPRGSRIFAGTIIAADKSTTSIEGARNGDIYLNSSTGKVYSLSAGSWQEQSSSLKGPEGEALNIVDSFSFSNTEVTNTTDAIGAKIDAKYSSISNQDIFAVTYTESDGNAIAYWFFKLNGIWNRVQLTGGISNLIENKYNDESTGTVTNKAYSINYINSLIGKTDGNKATTTYSKAQLDEMISIGIFFATRNVTSYTEVKKAYDEGKYIIAVDTNKLCPMITSTSDSFDFCYMNSSNAGGLIGESFSLSSSGWMDDPEWGAPPELHASQHSATGSDPITPSDIGAATMTEVNAAIQTAIGDALQEGY